MEGSMGARLGEARVELAEPPRDPLVAAVDLGRDERKDQRPQLDGRVEGLDQPVDVPVVPGGVEAAQDVEVAVPHRPRTLPRGQLWRNAPWLRVMILLTFDLLP